MTLDIGINFRATSNYVTDGTNETYCIADSYPTTRGGVTFGWPNANPPNARDRVAGNDRRLAGMNFYPNSGTQTQFRLDLPATGSYTIHLALGDAAYSSGYQYLKITDGNGGSTLLTVDKSSGTASQHFYDATGVLLTNTTWPGSEAGVSVSFTGTVLWLVLGTPTSQANQSTLAHLRVVQAGGGGGGTPMFRSGLSVADIGGGGSFFGNPIGRVPGGWQGPPQRRRRRKRFVDLGVR